MNMNEIMESMGLGLAYVILGIVILIIGKFILDLMTSYKMDDELTVKDNPALGVVLAGYFLGIIIVFIGAVLGPVPEGELTFAFLARMMGIDALYALGGVVALNIGRIVVDKFVLVGFDTVKEIVQDRNVGTGAVEAGCYIATALIVAGALSGQGGGPLTAVVFFVLGQAAIVLFALFYRWITKYDIRAEIERDNVAAGLVLGLSMIAMAIIVLKGVAGDFYSWGENLAWFGIEVVIGFILLMVLRKVTDALFLPKSTIAHEIAQDRNLNAAWLEGAVAVGIAAMIYFLV